MNTYYSSNDSFSFKERFFIGKVSAGRETLPRRRVKSAVAEEAAIVDANSRHKWFSRVDVIKNLVSMIF